MPVEVRVAAFLLGGQTYSSVASQLGIVPSSMTGTLRLVSRAICEKYYNEFRLPQSESELA